MGESGRSLSDSWSRRSKEKYNERDQDKTWRSFHRHDIKVGTLFHYAKQGGWQREQRSAPKANGRSNTESSTDSTTKTTDNTEIITEDAAALEFTARYCEQLRFDHDIGRWFKWTGSHWQLERTKLAFAWARELARELANEQSKKTRVAPAQPNSHPVSSASHKPIVPSPSPPTSGTPAVICLAHRPAQLICTLAASEEPRQTISSLS
jgi:primase-like protein/D5-like protein